MILKRKTDGYIRITSRDSYVNITADEVEIEISNYEEEPQVKDIEPLIPYLWTQFAPFNAELPKFGDTQSPTGCTQISLAMVAAYYGNVGINGKKYPRGIDKTAEYVSKKGTAYELTIPSLPAVPAPPNDGCFDYTAFNLTRAADFKTATQKAAIAKFLKHIAYSDYTSFGASASSCSLSRALSETINKRMHLANKAVVISAKTEGMDAFKAAIYEELKGGHPVIMASDGTRTEGDKKTAYPHTYICDGYRVNDDKYHLNLGGNEAQNGWFSLENAIKKWNGITWDWTHNTKGEVSMTAIINLHPEEV